jgi:hypothetical protein
MQAPESFFDFREEDTPPGEHFYRYIPVAEGFLTIHALVFRGLSIIGPKNKDQVVEYTLS